MPIKIIKIMKRKLILTESQYNRIFNSKKRKLVITENQYNKLLLTEAIADIIKTIFNKKINEKFLDIESTKKIIKNKPEIIKRIDEYLMAANKTKNTQDVNNLVLQLQHALNPADKEEVKSEANIKIKNLLNAISIEKYGLRGFDEVIKKVKEGKLSSEQKSQQSDGEDTSSETKDKDGKGTSSAMTKYKGSGSQNGDKDKSSATKDKDGGSQNGDKDKSSSTKDSSFDDVKNLKNGWLELEFNDDSKMNIRVFRNKGGFLYFYFQKNKNNEIVKLNGYAEGLAGQIRNERFKELRYGMININININEDDNNVLIFELVYINKEGKKYKSKFPLNNLKSIKVLKNEPPSDDSTKKEDSEDDEITPKEFWDSIVDDKIVRDAILKKPGFFSRLFGFYRGKGIKPAEDTLRKLATLSNENKLDYPGKEFETGKIITGAFIQPNIDINSIIPINEKFKSMVAKSSYTDIKIKLWSNLKLKNSKDGFTKTKYKIMLGKKIESVDGEYDVYEVTVLNRKPEENEKENLGKSKLKITNYGKKK
jgi:hypothetical protein